MRAFFEFFARRHLLANLVTTMTLLLGLGSLMTIRRDIWPNVDYGVMIITTRYPGASPEDVELNATNKIEDELKAVTGIDRISSVSMENISVIFVVLDPDARNQDDIKGDIEEAVGRVTDFPPEITESPLVTDVKTAIFPVIEVGLAGDVPYSVLRETARRLERKLESVDGVSSVKKFGYRAREVRIEVLPRKMNQYQIPLREVIAAIEARNIRATAGSFESYTSERNLVTLAQFRDPLEVRDVIVRSTFDGPAVMVKDLAIVKDDFEDARILSRMGGRQAISFQVSKKETADAIRTVDAIRAVMEGERALMPEGVEILYSNDFSRYVRNRFDVVRANLLIGLLLVVGALSLFLNLRSAFWVAMGIPVALLGVIFLLPAFDAYLDSISLAAMIIVLGIIVDDGIIVAENIQRHRERGMAPLEAAVTGIHEVFPPVVTTVLTTFLAFAPMFFMKGIMGSFIFVIPLVISLALAISLVEVVVALPAHLTAGIRVGRTRTAPPPRKSWFLRLVEPFRTFMLRLLKLRYLLVVLFVMALGTSLWYAVHYMKIELFPSNMAEQFNILVELPKGSSLQSTSDHLVQIERLIQNLPERELESFVSRIGTQEVFPAGGYPPGENENWAYLSVHLTPYTERERDATQIVEGLKGATDTMSAFRSVLYSIEAGGPPVGKAITIRVAGSDDSLRVRLADSVIAFLQAMPGVLDVDRDDKSGKEQVEVKIDYDRLARLGLTVADVAQSMRIAYDGQVVTSVRYGDEDVDYRVQLEPSARARPEFLSELLIPNRQGRLIPLREAAKFKSGPGPSNYLHHDRERAITITGDVNKAQVTSLEVTGRVLDQFDMGRDWPGMRLVVGGEAQETEESMQSLFKAFVLAVVAIYFLLILLFNSPTQPIVVLAAIPFGIMGVILAFALHGEALGFVALMGVVGLGGVVVNDSLVLVSHINRLREQNPNENLREIVARATADRLRPVVLTSITTVVGLLPLAYGIGGSDPYMAPMALALAYGLLFASPITIILVPCLYMIGQDLGGPFRRQSPH